MLKTWIEDFVDEDTGEVVSIERNDVVIDRETVIEPEHVDIILESGVQNILVDVYKRQVLYLSMRSWEARCEHMSMCGMKLSLFARMLFLSGRMEKGFTAVS